MTPLLFWYSLLTLCILTILIKGHLLRYLVYFLFLSLMFALFLLHFVARVVFGIVDWAYNGLADKAGEL